MGLPGPAGGSQGDAGSHDDDDEDGGGVARRGTATLAGGAGVCRLPWLGRALGFCVLPSPGSISGYDDAACVLQLLECNRLAVHEVGAARARKPTLHVSPGLQVRLVRLA